MSFQRRPTLQEVHSSRREASERLTSDFSKISDWGKANLVLFNASKTQFLHYQLDTTFQITILSSSMPLNCLLLLRTLNIIGLSFTYNLNWKLHISSLVKTASMMLGVLSCLRQFYSPPQLLTLYKDLIHPCMEYASRVGRLHS